MTADAALAAADARVIEAKRAYARVAHRGDQTRERELTRALDEFRDVARAFLGLPVLDEEASDEAVSHV